jgi:hypothetical protein
MSWNVSVSNTPESGLNVEDSIAKAKADVAPYIAALDADLGEKVKAAIGAQLACIGALAGEPNATRIVTASAWGHLNADGSGDFGIGGHLSGPVPAEV